MAKQLQGVNHLAIYRKSFCEGLLRSESEFESSNSPPPSSKRQNRDWVLYDLGNTVESDRHIHNS